MIKNDSGSADEAVGTNGLGTRSEERKLTPPPSTYLNSIALAQGTSVRPWPRSLSNTD